MAVTFTPGFPLSLPLVITRVLERLPRHWHVAIVTVDDEHLEEKKRLIEAIWAHNPDYKMNGKYIQVHGVLSKDFNINQYSCYLTSPKFYGALPSNHVLIFQMDTMLMRQDDYKIDMDRTSHRRYYLRDFFEFPYIGAPWAWREGCVKERRPLNDTSPEAVCHDTGNGGFSLRKKSSMLNVTMDPAFRKLVRENDYGCDVEDMVFANFMRFHPYWHTKLPKRYEGRDFAMETLQDNDPLGTHKPWYMYGWDIHPDVRLLEKLVMKKNEDAIYKWLFSEDGKADAHDLGRGPLPPYPKWIWESFIRMARAARTKH